MSIAGLSPAVLSQAAGERATGSQQTTFQAMTQVVGVMIDSFVAGRGDRRSAGGNATGYADEASAYAAKHKPADALAAIYTMTPTQAFEQRWSTWADGKEMAQPLVRRSHLRSRFSIATSSYAGKGLVRYTW